MSAFTDAEIRVREADSLGRKVVARASSKRFESLFEGFRQVLCGVWHRLESSYH
jgi:hypothetical protein